MTEKCKRLLAEVKEDHFDEYTKDGRYCFKTVALLSWYQLKCRQYNLKPRQLEHSLHYEAEGADFTFTYCEGDVILSYKED